MKRLTDPCENLRCYIMVHGGIDRHERLLDVEWIEEIVALAKEASGPDYNDRSNALERLKRALSE